MKNWRQMMSIFFHSSDSPLIVPQLFDTVVDQVIKINKTVVPSDEDPLNHIPRDTILLDFNAKFNSRVNPLCKNDVNVKLAKLAELANLNTDVTCYSIRKGACVWAIANGCPPELLQIIGRWCSVAYREYISYSTAQLRELSKCMLGKMKFQDASLGAQSTQCFRSGPYPWES